MAHINSAEGYNKFVHRLNRTPQGAPHSKFLFEILKILLSEREASLLSLIPVRPFTRKKAARIWGLSRADAGRILDGLAGRAMLVDMYDGKIKKYVLPPPMAGFFEFSLMRVRRDIDQNALSELFYRYINVEEDFIRELMATGETALGRIFVNESALSRENALFVLDYERAGHVIKTASAIGIGLCYCRRKMINVKKGCNNPLEICMTFNSTAGSLIRHSFAREVSASECMDLLDEARGHGLVQFGENGRERVNFICNCCGCCCEAMIAARKFGILRPVQTTSFLPVIEKTDCNGCGKCISFCPVEALSLVSANDPLKPKRRIARIDESICLGCGVCVRGCPGEAITLQRRKERVVTPLNSVHRFVLSAISKGKLQNLIFDNRVLWSHRALGAVLGVILNLSPVKQVMAKRQLGSRFLETVIGGLKF